MTLWGWYSIRLDALKKPATLRSSPGADDAAGLELVRVRLRRGDAHRVRNARLLEEGLEHAAGLGRRAAVDVSDSITFDWRIRTHKRASDLLNIVHYRRPCVF